MIVIFLQLNSAKSAEILENLTAIELNSTDSEGTIISNDDYIKIIIVDTIEDKTMAVEIQVLAPIDVSSNIMK